MTAVSVDHDVTARARTAPQPEALPGSDGPQKPTTGIEQLAVGPRRAAELLDVSHQTIYGLLNSGTLRSVKVGRRRLIPMSSLQELLDGAA